MANAVRLAFDVYPVFGCRFVEKLFRPYWQRCSSLQNACEFHEIANSEQEKATTHFLLLPLDPFVEPQVKVGLFRSDYDTLCIKMTHILADGGASMQYLQLLSSIYRKLKKQPNFQPNPNLDGGRSYFEILRHTSLPQLMLSCSHVSVPKVIWQFLTANNGNLHPCLLIRRIGPKHFSCLKTYAKSHNVTIGDILLTAYYRALFKVIDPPENVAYALFIPVNLRKYLPESKRESMGMLSATYFANIKNKKDASFEETLSLVHAALEKEKSKQTELALMFMMELVPFQGFVIPHLIGPSVSSVSALPEFSNIGVIDAQIADFGDVPVEEILSAGPTMMPPLFCLGSNTFNGELRLTVSLYCDDEYRVKVEGFLDVLVKELPIN